MRSRRLPPLIVSPSTPAGAGRAALATLFLTVFLDLLGFGLVIPFLPEIARRDLGASDVVATLLGTAYSLMQFLFVPLWGRLSDRVGRRPVLLWSIGASAVGMTLLGLAPSLWLLFAARVWSGIATANVAVAQAYIADATPPERRAQGMGMIGLAFGLGFIAGPWLGGQLGQIVVLGRQGPLAAFAAAVLSLVNLLLAFTLLPESLAAPGRTEGARPWTAPDLDGIRRAARVPGVALALVIDFVVIFWFAGMEQTFALFADDALAMSVADTGRVFALMGILTALVQGGLIQTLTRRFGESRLVLAGTVGLAAAFALVGSSAWPGPTARWAMLAGAALIGVGAGLFTPSISSHVSRRAGPAAQGATLGTLQSAGALARVFGPAAAGLAYQELGGAAPYLLGSAGMLVASVLSLRLRPPDA